VEFVDAALRTLPDLPLLVLACARSEIDESFPALWSGRPLTRFALPPLTSKACQRLARHVLGGLGDERAGLAGRARRRQPLRAGRSCCARWRRARRWGEGVVLAGGRCWGMVQARLDGFGGEGAAGAVRRPACFGQSFAAEGVQASARRREGRGLDWALVAGDPSPGRR
jgi:hypothetical protein